MTVLWIKAFHIIFVTTWFAGLFYLPRLFVYHAMSEDTTSTARFKIMERKLFYGIMTPSAVLAILLGIWALYQMPGYLFSNWMIFKLILVGLLVIYHFSCGLIINNFKEDKNFHSHVWYRWFNEAPVLALVAIVILAVIKPF